MTTFNQFGAQQQGFAPQAPQQQQFGAPAQQFGQPQQNGFAGQQQDRPSNPFWYRDTAGDMFMVNNMSSNPQLGITNIILRPVSASQADWGFVANGFLQSPVASITFQVQLSRKTGAPFVTTQSQEYVNRTSGQKEYYEHTQISRLARAQILRYFEMWHGAGSPAPAPQQQQGFGAPTPQYNAPAPQQGFAPQAPAPQGFAPQQQFGAQPNQFAPQQQFAPQEQAPVAPQFGAPQQQFAPQAPVEQAPQAPVQPQIPNFAPAGTQAPVEPAKTEAPVAGAEVGTTDADACPF